MIFKIDRKYIDEGLITEREHPTEPYLIYNYTPLTQFSKQWDDVTMQCRGLIVEKETGKIIARPFSKFFNWEEHILTKPIPKEMPNVYDKRDGSLGILYWGKDGTTPYIATRGSFTSDQAQWATAWFRKHQDFIIWDKNLTYLFEIIFPENRIVVDYKGYKGLDLLAIIDTETGVEIPHLGIKTDLGTPVTRSGFTSYEELKALNQKNKEGFILHYPTSNLRLKIKFEDYVRLHKIMTGLSEIGVWEMLRDGKDIITILGETPDEMHGWLQEVIGRLTEKFVEIENKCYVITTNAEHHSQERKARAEYILGQTKELSGVCFSMLDGKNYKETIWKMLRPVGSKTFRVDIDR